MKRKARSERTVTKRVAYNCEMCDRPIRYPEKFVMRHGGNEIYTPSGLTIRVNHGQAIRKSS